MEEGIYVCTKCEHAMCGLSDRYIRGLNEPGDVVVVPASHDSYKGTLQSRVRRLIRREIARHSRFMRQKNVLDRNERHYLVIRRCLHYHDRIPRKYRRAYGEIIRSMRSIEGVRIHATVGRGNWNC